jgi:hypothetical protein
MAMVSDPCSVGLKGAKQETRGKISIRNKTLKRKFFIIIYHIYKEKAP